LRPGPRDRESRGPSWRCRCRPRGSWAPREHRRRPGPRMSVRPPIRGGRWPRRLRGRTRRATIGRSRGHPTAACCPRAHTPARSGLIRAGYPADLGRDVAGGRKGMDVKDPKTEAELRRGVLQLVALALLEQPRYGYELIKLLGEAGF